MTTKRLTSASRGVIAAFAALVCAVLIAVGLVSFGILSAGGSALGDETAPATSEDLVASQDFLNTDELKEPSASRVLKSTAPRDMTQGIEEIAAEEEAARIAAEEAARAEEQAHIAAAEEAKRIAAAKEAPALSDVDFSCGKEAFMVEWTERLDAYLAGSPLAGYGSNFAAAAWEYGIDPRWSAAISNTESGKGSHCFRPYNAWGWMIDAGSWSSWEQSIDAHAKGLADHYGFTISVANAKKYCPPTYMDWYEKTVAEMAKI